MYLEKKQQTSIINLWKLNLNHFWTCFFLMNQWIFLTVSAMIWELNMYMTGILFLYFRRKRKSILGAIVCNS